MSKPRPFISSELNAKKLTTHQFRVLAHVTRRAGRSVCTASILGMSRHTGLHRKTVRSALKSLEEMNLIRQVDSGYRPVDSDMFLVPAEIDDAGLRLPEFRLLYYVIQKESAHIGCYSGVREIMRDTRLKHADLKDAISNLSRLGWITVETYHESTAKEAWNGVLNIMSSRYRSMLKEVPATATAPESESESEPEPEWYPEDEVEPAGVKLPCVQKSEEQVLMDRIMSMPVMRRVYADDQPEDLKSWIRRISDTEFTHFHRYGERLARAAAVLFSWRCYAAEYPRLFGVIMGERDLKAAAHCYYHAPSLLRTLFSTRCQLAAKGSKAVKAKVQHIFEYAGRAITSLPKLLRFWSKYAPEDYDRLVVPVDERVTEWDREDFKRAQREHIRKRKEGIPSVGPGLP